MVFFACLSFLFILLFPTVVVIISNILCCILGCVISINTLEKKFITSGVINLSISKNYISWRTGEQVIEGKVSRAKLYLNVLVLEVNNFDHSQQLCVIQSALTTQSWRRLCRVSLNCSS
ncbi:protein YgfX [Pseudoalteromonas aurantia]|uniref:protein YgfX n=1 Tax=Pseudoalteromonas aurantia TaxID=43654 RepID=UPI00384D213F